MNNNKKLSSEWPEAEAARVFKVAESYAKKSSTHKRPSLEDLKELFGSVPVAGLEIFSLDKNADQLNKMKKSPSAATVEQMCVMLKEGAQQFLNDKCFDNDVNVLPTPPSGAPPSQDVATQNSADSS